VEKTFLELNVDMKNHTQVNIQHLDGRKHISQEETYAIYFNIREKGQILFDLRVGKFNRVVLLKVEDTYWYLSAAADKGGQDFEELLFMERTEEDIKDDQRFLEENYGEWAKLTTGVK
jgi:hypothetical protein